MLLHDLIIRNPSVSGSRLAVIKGQTSLSYANLDQQMRLAAAGLVERGLQPHQRVAVYLNKHIQAVVSYLACSYAGTVFVPINPLLKPTQVGHILRDCDISALVTTSSQATDLSCELADCRTLRNVIVLDAPSAELSLAPHLEVVSWHELVDNVSSDIPPAKRIDADVAAILYTSGSTGRPKGVVLSHRNLVAGAASVAQYLQNTPDDVILAALPFSFDAGFSQLTTAFAAGASVALMDYLLPRDVIRAVVRHGVTGLTGVPPLWIQLARLDWPVEAAHGLRYIANTGGAMPSTTLAALRERLPKTQVFLMYGLTEAFRSTYLPPQELDKRPNSIGKAIPNAEILVVRDDGTPCEPGEPGELVHRGALVAMGYWNDRTRTAERFRPAPGQPPELPFPETAVWSGDTVVKDADGFLYFVSRQDDMIKSSGYRISPTEVEEAIYATNLVDECAALGIPHPELGQAVAVVFHTKQPAGPEMTDILLKACRTRLPNYMLPREIIWGNALPRNPNGKIDRKKLAEGLKDLFEPDC